jgi:spore germination protein GerM
VIGRRALAALLTAAVAAIGAAGCGVSAQSEPQRIDRADVPFGLAGPVHDEPTTTAAPQSASYTIYLVAGDRLRAVTRAAHAAPTPVALLSKLADGPTPAEADAGLRTLLSPDTTVEHVRITDDVATVELTGAGAAQPAGSEGALAIAQLVYTTTGIPGVARVRFEVDGKPAEIPRGDGTLTRRPVSRADYALAAP